MCVPSVIKLFKVAAPVPPLATESVPVVPATIGRAVASDKLNAGVVSLPPNDNMIPP